MYVEAIRQNREAYNYVYIYTKKIKDEYTSNNIVVSVLCDDKSSIDEDCSITMSIYD